MLYNPAINTTPNRTAKMTIKKVNREGSLVFLKMEPIVLTWCKTRRKPTLASINFGIVNYQYLNKVVYFHFIRQPSQANSLQNSSNENHYGLTITSITLPNQPTFPAKFSHNSIFFSIDIPRESASPGKLNQYNEQRDRQISLKL